MVELLATGFFSARELSGTLGMPEKEVSHHLTHIAKSLKRTVEKLEVTPAACRLCGFTFSKRARLTAPGRCPVCRRGSIDPPLFAVLEREGRGRRR